jgi:hypothetical protein
MSRGGLLLRSAAARTELAYSVLDRNSRRHGPRPPKLGPLNVSGPGDKAPDCEPNRSAPERAREGATKARERSARSTRLSPMSPLGACDTDRVWRRARAGAHHVRGRTAG